MDSADEDLAVELDGLWAMAGSWSSVRRDLLGLADASTRHADMGAYTPEQRRAIYEVWSDLMKPTVGQDCFDRHIDRFAELGIDITGTIGHADNAMMEVYKSIHEPEDS